MADVGFFAPQIHRRQGNVYLNEKVQKANQAALGLPDALVYLVSAQLGVGLEAQFQPRCGGPMREEHFKGKKA